ncbi:GatB/YqeY domain-containing protein [Flavobacteriaceae bacterium]|nr:GatB/YqeY domain-containing protein [Flavobacteriaceae bacterium]
MSLENNISIKIIEAMKAKDSIRLEALRAIKTSLLLVKTEDRNQEVSESKEVLILQKLVKQRKDSAVIFRNQNRIDLAEPEEAQAKVISEFLPKQLSELEIEKIVIESINKISAQGIKDMGKVMGVLSTKLAGKADGKTISNIVRQKLSS